MKSDMTTHLIHFVPMEFHIHIDTISLGLYIMVWALTHENLLSGFATNKGADHSVHLRRLISAFVLRFLESIISKLASRIISIF